MSRRSKNEYICVLQMRLWLLGLDWNPAVDHEGVSGAAMQPSTGAPSSLLSSLTADRGLCAALEYSVSLPTIEGGVDKPPPQTHCMSSP
mmetsp:Transcript_72500/g.121759  ORF Transcript_72500/g.121759 Transcript_72500/m.121759 type:complete len:89 (-) Transcript_72500:894-1160(-)